MGPGAWEVQRARPAARARGADGPRTAAALQANGFVEQDRESGKYQLGAGLLRLGNSYLDLNELRARSLVHAERLAQRADAAVRVGVMYGSSVIVVHHVFRPDSTLQILRSAPTARPREALTARRPRLRAPADRRRPDRRAAAEATAER